MCSPCQKALVNLTGVFETLCTKIIRPNLGEARVSESGAHSNFGGNRGEVMGSMREEEGTSVLRGKTRES